MHENKVSQVPQVYIDIGNQLCTFCTTKRTFVVAMPPCLKFIWCFSLQLSNYYYYQIYHHNLFVPFQAWTKPIVSMLELLIRFTFHLYTINIIYMHGQLLMVFVGCTFIFSRVTSLDLFTRLCQHMINLE